MRSSNDFQDVASSPQMDMRSELPADAIRPMDLPQPCERSACDQDAGLPASDDMLVFEEPLQVTAVDLPFTKQEPFSNAAGFYSLLKTLRSSTSPGLASNVSVLIYHLLDHRPLLSQDGVSLTLAKRGWPDSPVRISILPANQFSVMVIEDVRPDVSHLESG